MLGHHKERCIRRDGTIIAMTAASEGAGFHALFGPGMSLFSPHDDNIPPQELGGIETMIYSDGVSAVDIGQFYTGQIPLVLGDWEAVLGRLTEKFKDKKPVVAVYPMGAVQIGHFDEKEEGEYE